jgi:hypothetical protein
VRRYRLPAGHAEVLVDPDSPYHAAPLVLALAGVAGVLPRLLEAYRSGEGVPYAEFGRQLRRGIAAANRPMVLHGLGSAWLPAVPEIDRRPRPRPGSPTASRSRSATPPRSPPGGSTWSPSSRPSTTWAIPCGPCAARAVLADGGSVLVADERVADAFTAAGFTGIEVLAIDNPFWRFYRLWI